MNRILWLLALSLMLLVSLVGCDSKPVGQPPSSKEIVTKTVSAIAQVSSYKFDTDVVNTYKIISGPNSGISITEWKGSKLIDISDREMSMTMDIAGDIDDWSIQMYFTGGWEYRKTTSLHLSRSGNPWDKTLVTDKSWASETQKIYYIELLKTATKSSLLGSENINGVDYYVMNIMPSVQAIVDWVVSQEQPVGPQMDVMNGGAIPVVRVDAYQGSSIKLWINQESYLPLKVEINADFQGDVGGGNITTDITPYTPTTNPVNSSFQGQINFANYDQPVSIQIPQEALDAKEVVN